MGWSRDVDVVILRIVRVNRRRNGRRRRDECARRSPIPSVSVEKRVGVCREGTRLGGGDGAIKQKIRLLVLGQFDGRVVGGII